MVAILNSVLTSVAAVLALTITGAAAAAPLALGRAAAYGALSSVSITNVGASVIDGNLGTQGMSITGFPPGVVVGQTDMNNANTTAAYADFAAALGVANMLVPTVEMAGKATLDGERFAAGVYHYSGAVGLGGKMTFDGEGDANAVWVLQIAETLITASASQVVLAGGARSANIFWVVGSSATLGTYSTLHGSVLANAAVTANTGATVFGSLYAGSSVNLQSASVTAVNKLG